MLYHSLNLLTPSFFFFYYYYYYYYYSGVETLPNIFNQSLAASVGLGILGALGFKSDVNPHTGTYIHRAN